MKKILIDDLGRIKGTIETALKSGTRVEFQKKDGYASIGTIVRMSAFSVEEVLYAMDLGEIE